MKDTLPIYVSLQSYSSPTTIKVIGATSKKVRCAYIPMKDVKYYLEGGEGKIDVDYVPKQQNFLGTLKDDCITYKDDCFFLLDENDYDKIYTWSTY